MVLQSDFDGIERGALNHLVAEDIALLAQDLGDGDLHLGGRNFHDLLAGHIGVADPGEIICDRISHIVYFF